MHPKRQVTVEDSPARTRTLDCFSSTLECLVVAADEGRRNLLAWAAREAGWQTASCGDVQSALEFEQRRLLHLAIIDLVDAPRKEGDAYRSMVERFARGDQALLIVCGHEAAPDEEVWVRRLGAWMYLPGVQVGDELSALCGEARLIVERLSAARRPSRSPGERPLLRPR